MRKILLLIVFISSFTAAQFEFDYFNAGDSVSFQLNDLRAFPDTDRIYLTWTTNINTHYAFYIYKGSYAGSEILQDSTGNKFYYDTTGLVHDTTYRYYVVAYDSSWIPMDTSATITAVLVNPPTTTGYRILAENGNFIKLENDAYLRREK